MACRSLVCGAISYPALASPALSTKAVGSGRYLVNDRAFGFEIVSWSGYLELVPDSICSLTSVLLFQSRVRFHHFETPVSLSRRASSRELSTGNLFRLAVSSLRSRGRI